MTTLAAVFERGVFRPITPVKFSIPEGQHVKLRIETIDLPNDILQLAARVYDGLSAQQIDEIEQIILDRKHFFERGTG